MPQAIVDPSELRRFANHLKQFNQDLQSRMGALHAQLNGLNQTWRDKEHDKFYEEFEQTMKAVTKFIEIANQHIPFLLRKAERVEEYLQQR
jgi:WXG100 family type VII secretion target